MRSPTTGAARRTGTSRAGTALPLAVLLAAPALAQADATIVNNLVPALSRDLQASVAESQLAISSYLFSYAVLLITCARLGQTYGFARLFAGGVAAFGAASLACGLAPNAGVLIVARAVQGAGAAMMAPQTLTGVQLLFSGAARARALGWYTVAVAGGAVIGQVFGGLLVAGDVAGIGWRVAFLVNVPLCAVLVLVARRVLPIMISEVVPVRALLRGVDLPGVAALSATLLLLLVPLTLGPAAGWPVWALLSLTAVPATAWLFWCSQRRDNTDQRVRLVALAPLAHRPVAAGLLALLLAGSAYYGLLFVLAQYVQDGLHRGALISALTLVPWVLAFASAGYVSRLLPPSWAPRLPPLGYLLLALAFLAVAVNAASTRGLGWVALLLFAVGGFGTGLGFTGLLAHLSRSVSTRYAADISGATTTTLQVGGALGVTCWGSVYAAGSASAPPSAFAATVTGLAAAAAAASAAAYWATRPDQKDHSDAEACQSCPG